MCQWCGMSELGSRLSTYWPTKWSKKWRTKGKLPYMRIRGHEDIIYRSWYVNLGFKPFRGTWIRALIGRSTSLTFHYMGKKPSVNQRKYIQRYRIERPFLPKRGKQWGWCSNEQKKNPTYFQPDATAQNKLKWVFLSDTTRNWLASFMHGLQSTRTA